MDGPTHRGERAWRRGHLILAAILHACAIFCAPHVAARGSLPRPAAADGGSGAEPQRLPYGRRAVAWLWASKALRAAEYRSVVALADMAATTAGAGETHWLSTPQHDAEHSGFTADADGPHGRPHSQVEQDASLAIEADGEVDDVHASGSHLDVRRGVEHGGRQLRDAPMLDEDGDEIVPGMPVMDMADVIQECPAEALVAPDARRRLLLSLNSCYECATLCPCALPAGSTSTVRPHAAHVESRPWQRQVSFGGCSGVACVQPHMPPRMRSRQQMRWSLSSMVDIA